MARILYLQYANPAAYPPLLHSASMLAERGWEVLFLGVGVRGAASLVVPEHPRIRHEQVVASSGGRFGSLKYGVFGARTLAAAAAFKPDWCYASDAPSTPIALAVKKLSGARLLYHEHDAPAARASGRAVAIDRARAEVARSADIVVAPTAARLDLIPGGSGKRFVVFNCPRLNEVADTRERRTDSKFKLAYSGSLSRDRLTPAFVDALARLPASVELHVFGYETAGHPNYMNELLDRARALNLADRVQYHGPIAQRSELLRRLRGHDLGISTITVGAADRNLQTLAGASNKAFEYLSCGIPLLVSREREWKEMFVDPGYAIDCDPSDPASIATGVNILIDNPDHARALGEAGRLRVLKEWNYETQFAGVLTELDS